MNTNMINIFNLFAAIRCCRDKRQGKKEDGELGSSLIRVGYENSILDQRRFYEIKLVLINAVLIPESSSPYRRLLNT